MITSFIRSLKDTFCQSLYFFKGLIFFANIFFIHEFGKLIACKAAGLSVPFFTLGFGPTLAHLITLNTDFILKLIPFGGYLTFDADAFQAESFLTRLTIMVAGPCANFLCAWLIFVYQKRSFYEFYEAVMRFNPVYGIKAIIDHYKEWTTADAALHVLKKTIDTGLEQPLYTFALLNISIGFFMLISALFFF